MRITGSDSLRVFGHEGYFILSESRTNNLGTDLLSSRADGTLGTADRFSKLDSTTRNDVKRTLRISTLMLVFAVTMLIWLGFQNPVMADVPSQRLMTSTRPTTGPVVPPANLPPTSGITSKPVTLKSKGLSAPKEMTAKPKAYSRSPRNPGDLVDNWSLEVNNNFEGTVPITASCIVTEGTQYGPRQERRWKEDDTYAYSGAYSIWPARGGNNPLDPATNDYPPALDSWLICGPYDFTNAQYFQVDFHLWVDIPDATPENYDDFVAVVYSLDWDTTHDGSWYGEQYAGNFRQWITQSLSFPNPLRRIDGGRRALGTSSNLAEQRSVH